MEKLKHLILGFLPLLMVFSLSCEGPEGPAGPVGPAGPTGAVGATGPAGPAGIGAYKFIDFETVGENWFLESDEEESGITYAYLTSIPDITPTVVNSGAVLAFVRFAQFDEWSVWSPLPFSYKYGSTVTSHLAFLYAPYFVDDPENFLLYTYDSHSEAPTWAGLEAKFRVVILYNSSGARIDMEALNKMSYEELETLLNSLD